MNSAIAGLGMTSMGKIYGKSATEFACEALELAATDAGINLNDIDGLLVNPGIKNDVDLRLQSTLQLQDLRLLTTLQGFGSSAGQMVQYASMAIQAGMADVVACVYADAPLQEGKRSSAAYPGQAREMLGVSSLSRAAGLKAAPERYA